MAEWQHHARLGNPLSGASSRYRTASPLPSRFVTVHGCVRPSTAQPIRPATHTIAQPSTPALKSMSRYIFGRTSALCHSVHRDAALLPSSRPCPGPFDQPHRVAPHSNTLHWYTLQHPQPCPSFEAKTRVRGLVGIAHERPSEQPPFSCFYNPSIRLLEECCFRPPRCNLGRRDPARISTCRTNSSGCLLGYTTLHSLAATLPPNASTPSPPLIHLH